MNAIKLKMAPFPYFMHANVELVDQVFPLLQDLCAEDDSQCYQNEYMLFSFENQGNFSDIDEGNFSNIEEGYFSDTEDNKEKEFTEWWASQVSEKFGIDLEVLREIYDEDKAHNTAERVNDIFWYGDDLGFVHLPALLINGELQDEFPTSEAEWLEAIS